MKRTLLLGATLLGSVSLTATASARPMTPEDVAKLESVGTIAVSPDGSRVAYTTNSLPDVTEGEKNGSTDRLLKIAYGPDNARVFLPDDVSPGGVSFSPDGRMVSFVWADEDEDRAVWGVPVDGGAPVKLAAVADTNVRSYSWSPDGSALYMLVGAGEDKQRDTQQKAGFNAVVYEEEGKLNRVFAASVGGSLDTKPSEIKVPGYVSSFTVTPDGSKAIIETAPTPNVDDSLVLKQINIIDLASGEVSQIIDTPGKIDDFEISPDSTKLSLIAAVDKNDPAATTLHMVDIASGAITGITVGAAEATVDTEFVDGGRLAAVIHKGANSFLRFYNSDGSQDSEMSMGNLAVTGIDAGGDRIVVRASSAQHPSELFAWENGAWQRWTNHNAWLSDIDFGKQSVITYTARDGQKVEGILIEPVGGAPAGGAPLIMNVHGGPEAHESNGWLTAYSKPGQVAAGQGYAVFLPNYRGSTGYGVAFAKQHQNDYAGKEFNDIVDAKRHLVATGIADADRTGITGGSYGGYASAWGATALSQEYAASVMFVGISNQISKFGTTDIPVEMFNVHSLKWPWDAWQNMLKVSPIYHVDKADTPILIMHGAEDTRVAPSQSYELYRNIKVRTDTPVRLVLYPGEGHGNQRAAARYDYNLRMMEWFDTYLKTGDRDATMPGPRPQLADGAKGAKAKVKDADADASKD